MITDVRRWIGVKTHGSSRFLKGVQACVEDVYGALECKQYTTAFFQARSAILRCMSIRSLCKSGELQEPNEFDQISFDHFSGLSNEEIDTGMVLIADLRVFDDEKSLHKWLANFERYVSETELFLGFNERLPILRSKDGFYTLLRIAKDWDQVGIALNIPSALPPEWTGGTHTFDIK